MTCGTTAVFPHWLQWVPPDRIIKWCFCSGTDAGEFVMQENFVDVDAEKEQAVKAALIIAEKRHARELKASLWKQEEELEKEKVRALEKQKKVIYFSYINIYLFIY